MIKRLTTTNKSTLGGAMDSRKLLESLYMAAMKCGNALSAFAASTKNAALLEKIGYTDFALRKLKNAELEVICQIIHDEAEAYLPEAGAFGYSQHDLKELQGRLMEYSCSFQANRQLFKSKAKTAGLMGEFEMGRRRAA